MSEIENESEDQCFVNEDRLEDFKCSLLRRGLDYHKLDDAEMQEQKALFVLAPAATRTEDGRSNRQDMELANRAIWVRS
jgi:hypothetical protein